MYIKGSIIRNGVEMPFDLIPQHMQQKFYLAALDEMCQEKHINPSPLGDRIHSPMSDTYYNEWACESDNHNGTYLIDSMPVNNLSTEAEEKQRKSDIAMNNQKWKKGNKIGSTIRILLVARKRGTLDLKAVGIIQDACIEEDYLVMLRKTIEKQFDHWYFQPIVTA